MGGVWGGTSCLNSCRASRPAPQRLVFQRECPSLCLCPHAHHWPWVLVSPLSHYRVSPQACGWQALGSKGRRGGEGVIRNISWNLLASGCFPKIIQTGSCSLTRVSPLSPLFLLLKGEGHLLPFLSMTEGDPAFPAPSHPPTHPHRHPHHHHQGCSPSLGKQGFPAACRVL